MYVAAVVKVRAQKGKGVGLLAVLSQPLVEIRRSADCLSAQLYMGAESPDELVLLGEWTSAEAHKRQFEALNASGAFDEAQPILAGPMETTYYTRLADS
jgi:quinol monooxygenase YgiN